VRARPLALTALFAGAAAIGTSALFVKVSEAGPIPTAFWRVSLALPVLWVWALVTREPAKEDRDPAYLRLMLLAGFFFAGDLAVWHWSIVLTSVATATLLANCAPLFVTLAAWLLFKERPRWLFLSGLFTALAGTALLLRGDFSQAGALLGDALGIATALFYAAYQLTVTRARAGASTAHIMAVSATITALILFPVALASGERFFPVTAHGWVLVVGLALIAHAAGQSLNAYAMAHLPATMTSVGLHFQPVVAAALAWVLLGEVLDAGQLAGAALVLIGIALARKGHQNARAALTARPTDAATSAGEAMPPIDTVQSRRY
jgi:drug/metabolite transporter (DMT)-like permease